MKSIKIMLLGIAFLVLAACAAPFWVAGASVGAVVCLIGLACGLLLCLTGFFRKDE